MEDPTIQKVSVKKKTHTSELKRRLDHSLAKKSPLDLQWVVIFCPLEKKTLQSCNLKRCIYFARVRDYYVSRELRYENNKRTDESTVTKEDNI